MLKVKVFTFSPVQENTYLLYNEHNKAIIIDPGCYFSAEQETLKNFIEDTQLEPVRLLNTHCQRISLGRQPSAKKARLAPTVEGHAEPTAA